MAGPGGRREGSGAKKGQHRIHVAELKAAIEKHVGMPFQDQLAITMVKLFTDFQSDHNVKEYLIFTENMSKRLLEQPVQEVSIDNNQLKELTDAQLQLAIKIATQQLNTEAKVEDSDQANDNQC